MRARKRDAVERTIIEALEAAGCLVVQHEKYDLEVQLPGPDARHLSMEVKTGTGHETKAQAKLRERGWLLPEVRTPEEALALTRVAPARG